MMDKTIAVPNMVCPRCGKRIHWDTLTQKGAVLKFDGVCCRKMLTSGDLNLLEYVDYHRKGNGHAD